MKTYGAVISLFLLVMGAAAAPAGKAFNYSEGFEDSAAVSKVHQWATNGTCSVNFLGLSADQVFKGKKALKLDITITGGSYCYWGMDLKVPCEGKLRMSARLFLGEGTDAQVGFGSNFNFPPTVHSGCWSAQTFAGPTGLKASKEANEFAYVTGASFHRLLMLFHA